MIGIVAFVHRRRIRRWGHSTPRSILSTDVVDAGRPEQPGPLPQTRMIVAPFNPDSLEANQVSGISAEQQPLGIGDPEAEMVTHHRLSSTSQTVPPRPGPVAPIPAGLPSKDIARLHADALSSQQPHDPSTSNVSRPVSSPNTVTESPSGATRTTTYNTRRLHTEVESLVRREMERLRTEGLVPEAPPSYAEGHG